MAFDGNEEPMTQPMQTSVVSNSDAAEMPPKVQPLAADLATECTMLSLRVFLPDGQPSRSFEYLTNEMVRAASTNNLLYQWNATGNEYFRIELQRSLQEGVSRFKKNSLDLAGKLPFALKMMSLGLGARDLWVDFSQAGGMYGTDDGMICGLREMLEVKGARLKAGSKRQFQIKKISVEGTGWKHLFMICRSRAIRHRRCYPSACLTPPAFSGPESPSSGSMWTSIMRAGFGSDTSGESTISQPSAMQACPGAV